MADVTQWHRRWTCLRLGPLSLKITLGPLTLMALLGALTAIALHPSVFALLFALEPPTPPLIQTLEALSLASAIYALLCLFLPPSLGQLIALPCLGLLLIVDAELALHLSTRLASSEQTLTQLRQIVAPEEQEEMFIPHPFLQYTGNPAHPRFNNLGFPDDRDFVYPKREGHLRVACIGGSTTASGYPEALEDLLNQGVQASRFEVMNFGLEGWNSAHVLANIALNVMDFTPDYVVFHQGWNDNRVLQGPCPRRDYAGVPGLDRPAQQPAPSPSLKRLLEFSLASRLFALRSQQDRLDFDPTKSQVPTVKEDSPNCEAVDDLWSYRRNLRHITSLTKAGGAQLILTTQPHSLNPKTDRAQSAHFIDETNAHVRTLAQEEGLPLVDLDKAMTGVMEDEFRDLGHMTEAGQARKGCLIADEILRLSSPPQ